MKRLIYQVAVGNPPPFYQVCIDSVASYVQQVNDHPMEANIDHIVQREPTIRLRPVNSHRSELAVERYGYLPHFEKANMFNYLDEYDQIVYIDADIFIKDSAPNIFGELDFDTTMAGIRECDMPLPPAFMNKVKEYSYGQYGMLKEMKAIDTSKGIPFYNTGVLAFNTKELKPFLNGETADEFVRREEFERFVNGEGKWKWASDQTPLNWWFVKENMKLKNLDWRWNALYDGVDNKMLSQSHFVHFFLATKLQKKGVDIVKLIEKLR
jgi:lipopolysaccharide biosynthesis glycosyltransferase